MADSKGRLVYTEPNLYAAEAAGIKFGNGKIASNITWNPEDLNISVDLQVVVPSRSDCGDIQQNFPVTFSNGLGVYTSFLGGSKLGDSNYLTADYTEASYSEIKNNQVSTTESLGISSIDIRFDAHFYPQVTMKLTDVRGYSLFMPAEEEYVNRLQDRAYNAGNATQPGRPYTNLFKAIFHFPYPKFLLTIKGFYGNKVTFILAVNDFKTALNGQNGNFDVTISFVGYMYGLYTDIPMNYIMIAPYIDAEDGQLTESSYWKRQSARFVSKAANSSGEGENATQPIPTFLELARNYAALDIQSEDTDGTETEEYYMLQSAYNSLDDIIRDYRDLINDFGSELKPIASGRSEQYDLYIINPTETNQTFSWNTNDKAKELYDKITEHMAKYSSERFGNCVISYPNLVREKEDKDANFTINLSGLTKVQIKKDNGKNELSHSGETIFNDVKYSKAEESTDFKNKLYALLNSHEGTEKQYQLLAFGGEKWIKDAKNKLTSLGTLRDKKMEEAAKSAVKLYSDKLGYSLTIENVFRMLFAHVECFFHHYLNNTVYEIKKDKDRTFKNLGIDFRMTDSDGIAVNENSKLLPFPALYSKTNELVYPGDDMRINDMLEVDLVERLHDAAKLCGKKAAEVSELMALNESQQNNNVGENVSSSGVNFPLPISFDGSFKPLTFMDAFCDNKNPYSNLPKTKPTGNTNYNLIDEILYMAYLRYCAYRICIKDRISNYSYEDEYFIACESENIKLAFPKLKKRDIRDLANSKNGSFYNKIHQEKRIAYDFSIPYTGNTILCTGFDTSENNSLDNLSETLKNYTKDYLRGIHVFPASTFDVFKKMSDHSVLTGSTSFKTYNEIFDIRNISKTDSMVVNSVVGTDKVSRNSVYYLGDGNETETKQLNHDNKAEYFDFIKCARETKEDYKGLYSPNAIFLEGNDYQNLFLSDFFWKQKNIESQAFLLLSLYIGSNTNQILFNKNADPSWVGVRLYRLRKLSALYYGALIYRLRYQIENSTDLVDMKFKTDNFGINKDIFNTRLGTYLRNGEYYYKKKEKKFTEDAPILSLLSSKNSVTYNNLVDYGHSLTYTSSKIHKTIDVLTNNEDINPTKLDDETSDVLNRLVNSFDFSSGLEGYFLEWVNTDFKTFLDILKNEYVTFNNDTIQIVDGKWNTIKFTEDGKQHSVYGFKYSEEDNSPNMFLNHLQCEQVTILVCVPNEKVYEGGLDVHSNFLTKADDVLHNLFKKLDDYYSEQKEETKEEVEQKVDETRDDTDDSLLKKTTYYTLKNLYDKWICGYGKFSQFQLPTPNEEFKAKQDRYEKGADYNDKDFKEMNNFLFVDAFYNDISDRFYCNPKLLYDLIMSCAKGEYNCSVYQFISKIAQDNKLLMKAFPVYNNFYSINTINDIFTPHMNYDVANNTMSKRGFGSTYILMYTNQPSKFLNEESKTEIAYKNDGFDLGDSLGHISKLDLPFSQSNNTLNIPVPAFGVTYGMQNQQYFKGMNINMDSPVTTDYSIANTLMLSQTGAKGDKNFPMGIGQDIYAIYSNRSYTITVEMMGCANIMPMMYFQLNNVPMFKGAYMIVSVSHSIKAGTMTTTFTGIRQSKYLYPQTTENMILTSIMDRINKERSGESSSRRGTQVYANVDGSAFTDELNITLDNALGAKYGWIPKSNGTPYPYKKRISKPKYIVLHYTAGVSSSSGMAGKLMPTWVSIWNRNDKGGGSADFGVDDGNIYQFTPDIDKWYASYCNGGGKNADKTDIYPTRKDGGYAQSERIGGIGIEMCCNYDKKFSDKPNSGGYTFTEEVLENTSKLCAKLIKHFSSTMVCTKLEDLDNIFSTHYRVSGKVCPGIWGWNTTKWEGKEGGYNNENELKKFKKRVWNKLVEYGYVKGKTVEIK